jgi:hypothetical protein
MAARPLSICLLLVATTVAAACSGSAEEPRASTPTAPPSQIPSDSVIQTPPPAAPEPPDAEMLRLARLAEQLAGRLPKQARPPAVHVTGTTTRWAPGDYIGTFADPDILRYRGRWYAYATNTGRQHLPTLTSRDLVTWAPVTDAAGRIYDPLPRVGDWVQDNGGGGGLWAPAVARIGDGWTAAYSARFGTVGGRRHNCIGLARSKRPQGPFRHLGDPVACAPVSREGVIDPDLYVDPQGTPWLLMKFSGVHNRRPAGILSRRLDPQGTGWAEGSQTYEILTHQGGWEGNTIENPSMIRFRGITYLFYSANAYSTEEYATGYAICEGPAGPCARPSDRPLLSSGLTGNLGPGGATAFEAGDSLRLLYHAWEPGQVGRLRRLHVAGLWQRPDFRLELVHPG